MTAKEVPLQSGGFPAFPDPIVSGVFLRIGRAVTALIVSIVWCAPSLSAATGTRRFPVGHPLADAIDDLRSQGLDVIYSSDLVRPDARVLAEPVAATPRGILEDLIAPHGLDLLEGPDGTLLVVKADGTPGQTGGIAGRIVSGDDRRPLPGASVSVPGTAILVATNPEGRFLIPRLTPGTWPLEARSADGHSQLTVDIAVTAGAMTPVAIRLSPDPDLLEQVVVTPSRHRIVAEQPEPAHVLEGEDLSRLVTLGDDALRAASTLPGAAAGDKSARFSLRGGEWNETLIVLDGLEIDQPFHLKDFLAFSGIIDSRTIESADVLTGGFPVEYGGRMSGVMDLSSAIPEDSRSTSLGVGMPNSRIRIDGRAGPDDVRWLAGARAWYPDAALDLVDPGGEDINPSYYDMLGKVEFHRPGGTTISAHALAARDIVDFQEEDATASASARYETSYVWLNIQSPWTPRLASLTQISGGSSVSDRRGDPSSLGAGASLVSDVRSSRFVGAKQDWIFRASDRALLKWGFDARSEAADYDYASQVTIQDPVFAGQPILVDRQVAAHPEGLRLGAYAAVRVKVHPLLTTEIGLRSDRQSWSGETQVDPRVNVVWSVGPRSTIRAAWGLFHQTQRIDELQVEDGVTRFFPAQLSEHRLISFEHEAGANLHFEADAYWREMSHLRPRFENLLDPIELFPETAADRVEIRPQGAVAKGVEILLRRDPSRIVGWRAGYTLSSVEDEIAGEKVPRSWDQRHAVNLGLGFRLDPGWQIDLSGVWHSGWPTTQVDARVATDPNGATSITPVLGPRNAERFPPYHRLDFRLSRRLALEDSSLTLYLEVLNLYGRKNVCCVDDVRFSPEANGEVRVDRTYGYWLGRIPSFGLRWEF